ncbi:ABC transporter substrate-binding protein [Nafulsella turpanensis]|uniref:ABC transporter substrate-binding protein n=1 Tax=Nafulsella turpanensis TaxID=1265690 RepID=UPI000348BD9E|nr:ABC transporter substrate-binding protein [Nafulsella turpanensis]
MLSLNKSLGLAFFLLFLWSCDTPEQRAEQPISLAADTTFHQTNIRYAKQFKVAYADGYKIVEVLQPFPGAEKSQRYLLLPHGMEKPEGIEADAVVRIPVDDMVMFSTTHIPSLDLLGASEVLTGFPTTDHISSEKMRERIEAGEVQDLGASNGLNIEKLMALSPDVVMAYGMGPQDKSLRSLQRTDIPVVLNADFLEQSPLGRAEWLKFTALFLNKEEEADSVFNRIVQRYDSLRALAATAEVQPEIFTGLVYNGTWFMPGGDSWAARFFEDAGGDFLWSDTEESGSLQLSFESVFNKAHDADFWIGTANYESLEGLKKADSRYSHFDAWQEGNVYTYTARTGAKGGNEYMELGYSRPDIVLADLIKILHPDLLPDYELYFYEKLE